MKSSQGSFSRLRSFWLEAGAALVLLLNLGVILFCCVVVALAFASGCGSRTVLVPESSPIRVGPGMTGRIYILNEDEWMLSDEPASVPEGWYLVPPSYVE